VEGKGQDIGGAAIAHVVEVEALHLRIAAERQLHLAGLPSQGNGHGLVDRRLQQAGDRFDLHRLDRRRQLVPPDMVVERDLAAHWRIVGDAAAWLKVLNRKG
jgi:hypothetical protein